MAYGVRICNLSPHSGEGVDRNGKLDLRLNPIEAAYIAHYNPPFNHKGRIA